MVDTISRESRSQNMRAIRSSKTKLEEEICKELWKRGFRFRKNVRDLFGKPDIAIKKYKVVIFIDSCFWHGCQIHYRIPKSNIDYWAEKIHRNQRRDREVSSFYSEKGWHIKRVWEHQIKDSFKGVVEEICNFINEAKKKAEK